MGVAVMGLVSVPFLAENNSSSAELLKPAEGLIFVAEPEALCQLSFMQHEKGNIPLLATDGLCHQ